MISALMLSLMLKGTLLTCEPDQTVESCIEQVEADEYDACIDQPDTTPEDCE